MMSPRKSLGVMLPLGGGDPIPLKKDELVIGRRPNCDIRLDFENISGKHCILKFIRGTWHVRDLGSTNGTTVDGLRISQLYAPRANHGKNRFRRRQILRWRRVRAAVRHCRDRS